MHFGRGAGVITLVELLLKVLKIRDSDDRALMGYLYVALD